MLEKLSGALKRATDKVANAVFLDKYLVDGIVRDLQRALIEADVNVALVREISEKIRKGAMDERLKGVEKKEHVIKLLHDELIAILGKSRELALGKREVWMLVGLYGAGKTTTIGKLAAYYSKRGRKVCAVGLDVHRPAAAEQLEQVAQKVGIQAFVDKEEKDALKIWEKYKDEVKKYDLVLVDSAGRDALSEDLIREIEDVNKAVKASERILVLQADIGQAAKSQAAAFKEAVDVSGVFISRMDSSAKGGGALTACAEANVGVVFIGTGEGMVDIEQFDPERFLSRLLGMGDLQSLMDKIHSVVGEKEIARQQAKMKEGKLSLRDVVDQVKSMGDVGGFDKIMSMVPGMGKVKEKLGEGKLEEQQSKVLKWEHIIKSMTEEEIEHPEILEKQTSRIQRIAHGSGTTTTEIRQLLKQYKMLNEMIKSQGDMVDGKMDQKTIMKLAKKFGKKMRL